MKTTLTAIICLLGFTAAAQHRQMQFFRPNSKDGLHTFETLKTDTIPFYGLKVRIGGNFAQDFQALRQENSATPVVSGGRNVNELMELTPGFNLAMANLNIDAQLSDGIRMNLTLYLSSRHHEETWVKGGYIQFDKLPFLHSAVVDNIMTRTTIKVGAFELDYGDKHFRRTDGGNAIYNPFVENYIMDAFCTEIGTEIYYHAPGGAFAMLGVSNGALNPTVVRSTKIDTATGEINRYAPAVHAKAGYDRVFSDALRARVSGSVYWNKSAASNTLFAGDRTGSHYFFAMENTAATAAANFRSGRYTPGFSQEVLTVMINPFVKYKGIELFGAYELAQGRTITEPDSRKVTQYAVDLIYRFPATTEAFWIGGRYNAVKAELQAVPGTVSIDRIVASAGWFLTKNIMLKGEYVRQAYRNFAATDIRSAGQFDGVLMQAVVGF